MKNQTEKKVSSSKFITYFLRYRPYHRPDRSIYLQGTIIFVKICLQWYGKHWKYRKFTEKLKLTSHFVVWSFSFFNPMFGRHLNQIESVKVALATFVMAKIHFVTLLAPISYCERWRDALILMWAVQAAWKYGLDWATLFKAFN